MLQSPPLEKNSGFTDNISKLSLTCCLTAARNVLIRAPSWSCKVAQKAEFVRSNAFNNVTMLAQALCIMRRECKNTKGSFSAKAIMCRASREFEGALSQLKMSAYRAPRSKQYIKGNRVCKV